MFHRCVGATLCNVVFTGECVSCTAREPGLPMLEMTSENRFPQRIGSTRGPDPHLSPVYSASIVCLFFRRLRHACMYACILYLFFVSFCIFFAIFRQGELPACGGRGTRRPARRHQDQEVRGEPDHRVAASRVSEHRGRVDRAATAARVLGYRLGLGLGVGVRLRSACGVGNLTRVKG